MLLLCGAGQGRFLQTGRLVAVGVALQLAQQHLLLAVLQLLVRARGGLEDLLVMISS